MNYAGIKRYSARRTPERKCQVANPVSPALRGSEAERPHSSEGAAWWLGSSTLEPEGAAAEQLTTLAGVREAGL